MKLKHTILLFMAGFILYMGMLKMLEWDYNRILKIKEDCKVVYSGVNDDDLVNYACVGKTKKQLRIEYDWELKYANDRYEALLEEVNIGYIGISYIFEQVGFINACYGNAWSMAWWCLQSDELALEVNLKSAENKIKLYEKLFKLKGNKYDNLLFSAKGEFSKPPLEESAYSKENAKRYNYIMSFCWKEIKY